MCKVVYLTSRCFDKEAKEFRTALKMELEKRKIEVVVKSTCFFKQFFQRHHTYGIAIAIDFFRDGKGGCGLTLNQRCSSISGDFAYNLSNSLDLLMPQVRWRDFRFVRSDAAEWYMFFNNVSASTKAVLYLCTKNNKEDWDAYNTAKGEIVNQFAEEIVRCLRSNYDYNRYVQSVRLAKFKARKRNGMAE